MRKRASLWLNPFKRCRDDCSWTLVQEVKTTKVVTAIWTVDRLGNRVHGIYVAEEEVLSLHSGEWRKVSKGRFICKG
jgi:hypothetical protein